MLMDSVGRELGPSTAETLVFAPWCVGRQLGKPESPAASTAWIWNCLEAPSHTLSLRGGQGPLATWQLPFSLYFRFPGPRVTSIHPRTQGLGQPLAQVKLPSPVSPCGASWGPQLTYPNHNPWHHWTPCEWFFFPSETKNEVKGYKSKQRRGSHGSKLKTMEKEGWHCLEEKRQQRINEWKISAME